MKKKTSCYRWAFSRLVFHGLPPLDIHGNPKDVFNDKPKNCQTYVWWACFACSWVFPKFCQNRAWRTTLALDPDLSKSLSPPPQKNLPEHVWLATLPFSCFSPKFSQKLAWTANVALNALTRTAPPVLLERPSVLPKPPRFFPLKPSVLLGSSLKTLGFPRFSVATPFQIPRFSSALPSKPSDLPGFSLRSLGSPPVLPQFLGFPGSSPVPRFSLEKVQGATRLGATGLRASERKSASERTSENLSKISENL